MTVKKRKKKDHNSYAWLKKEADRVFSIWIRKRDKGVCFTCGNKKEWKRQQNGHFVPRQYMALRYSEINCHCQCAGCNLFKRGAIDIYATKLVKKYGAGILAKLQKEKHSTKSFTTQDLKNIIQKYDTSGK